MEVLVLMNLINNMENKKTKIKIIIKFLNQIYQGPFKFNKLMRKDQLNKLNLQKINYKIEFVNQNKILKKQRRIYQEK